MQAAATDPKGGLGRETVVKRISIEQSFSWAQAVARREWPLLLPVMFAFLVLPPLAVDLLLPEEFTKLMTARPIEDLAQVQAAMVWLLPLTLGVLLIAAVGMLAIIALALTPRLSVGEAILLALRRVPVFAVATIGALTGVVIVATLLAVAAQLAGLAPLAVQGLLLIGLTIVILLGTARLALLGPVVAMRRIGPVAALSESWQMARGMFWRLLGGLMIYVFGAVVALFALMSALRVLILLGARAAGAPDLAPDLTAIVFRTGSGIVMTGSYLLIASFYRQLGTPSNAI